MNALSGAGSSPAMPSASPSPLLAPELPPAPQALRAAITAAWLKDEAEHVRELLEQARLPAADQAKVQALAADLVTRVRARAQDQGAIEAFMRQYDLGSEEGVLLMCVAEALLRIPDQETADKLIRDKLGDADWKKHMGESDSVLVNASTWGLMLTGKLVQINDLTRADVAGAFKRLIGRVGEPVIRLAVRQAMKIMGHQFVMGRSIGEALSRSKKGDNAHYRYSFDMLGEGALTMKDAHRYLDAYRQAIHAIGRSGRNGSYKGGDVFAAPSISIKLSALYPRYEHAKRARVMAELVPGVLELAQLARSYGIGYTVDAEEADRLELSLDIIAATFSDPSLDGWEGYGLAVQAYQKRTPYVIDFLADLARRVGRRIPVRLVKGAYWDAEIKRAQVEGHPGYPVFTRKQNTDVSYLACAKRMFAHSDALYPMFATHNAQTIAAVRAIAGSKDYEHQKLHGMGDDLYAEVIPAGRLGVPCRVYAPVGSHEDLLPYLVRRLLENGANSSFVNRITDEDVAIEDLIRDPVEAVSAFASIPHPKIPLPADLLRSQNQNRKNSMGANLANDNDLRALADQLNAAIKPWQAAPLVPGAVLAGDALAVTNPADRRQVVGRWQPADAATVEKALANAVAAQPGWNRTPAASRATILEHAADLLEARLPEFIALCVKEAGKTLPDGVAEVREAVDFLRYYAGQARAQFGAPERLPGPTGESNELQLHGRGVFVCISPWNFPLAIFLGQVAAALAAGNSVIAKPAEQTNLVGHAAVKLLHEAGVPEAAVQFLPGDGATVGAALTRDARVAGVAFTGSTETARAINRALAARDAAIGVLIAETGGQNAFIADSSSLPEAVVKDAISSAFISAGQRCSAARVLFVQDDIADKVMTMLAGAMAELKIGDPGLLSTDVGPVIDADALQLLSDHAARMDREARLIAVAASDDGTAHGSFFAPRAYELQSLAQLQREIFGPVLHVIRWKADQLDAVIEQINATGYGLTLGVHSRIDETIERIAARVRVGNVYVNRNQIGAVVGVQPFGGQGLSGTGPKAGGPHYLLRFATEKVVTVNTTAAGGNASLLTLGD
ncbi:bifunctional proline dehydrogenase/L-glutamate gamma-semialdehyde dehydrogenase PutA [Xanthomonas translucens pv. graminis]|uniref:Bifunctional protein PutA n=3 Tax=Xanthomonas translucens group TaxID=3390202 RepID=A0A1M4L7H4_9XANT|nr:bifunctional proline dehydrogenase/L-glutamate gamma-semialdehyde dehydrogenase PutA [Xanthomonas translucens]OAX61394.1 bifunctional proline dehydrogenase/L-glutamate gamma-semialdehyde dehydrogenase [Xanthomonas translucens pv. graminis]UKE54926.1 bifunctional proline dehydrogenase/L-glutamate gamma-semialdehyde dehydrogenase PutA [Xanthomonas translucens pv. graminis]WIH09296.1 bifunctional proline dehydrogenase/L-glutamate gamma-semialdehyde dehydrogenase PutA [Xanthomonas translucens pv.